LPATTVSSVAIIAVPLAPAIKVLSRTRMRFALRISIAWKAPSDINVPATAKPHPEMPMSWSVIGADVALRMPWLTLTMCAFLAP